MIQNINDRFGSMETFNSVEEMEAALHECAVAVNERDENGDLIEWEPDDGLVEGRDYRTI